MPARRTLSEQIRRRIARGRDDGEWSYNSLAKDAGISRATLWRFVSGEDISAATLDAIAARLKLELKEQDGD